MKYNGHKYVITDVPGIVKQCQSEGCSKMLNARIICVVEALWRVQSIAFDDV